MSMIHRLKYLHAEGFDISSIMGYDSAKPEMEKGEGKILYRFRNGKGNWRIRTECFEVTYDEMQECSSYYIHRILG